MKGFLYVVFVLLLVSSTHGATLHGTIYDRDLSTIQGVIVEVDSSPAQRHISKYGGYSFELEPGNYTLTVFLSDQSTILVEEPVSITGRGDYVVDLHVTGVSQKEPPKLGLIVMWGMLGLLIILVIILSLIILKIRKRKKQKQEVPTEEDIEPKEFKVETSDDILKKRILKIIIKNDKKITQKEIRKKISLSEAKISHVITELVREGKVKKIKQGRINILVVTKVF